MRIKYTGYADNICLYMDYSKKYLYFKRNEWKETLEKDANILLKDPHFISESDYVVDMTKLKTPIRLGLYRFGAMGDLIQLIPIVKYLKKQYGHTIILITQACYINFFKNFPDIFDEIYSNEVFHRDKCDKMIYLDGVLEMDHSISNEESKIHRVKIFEQFFNIHLDSYDFSVTLNDEVYLSVENKINAACQ